MNNLYIKKRTLFCLTACIALAVILFFLISTRSTEYTKGERTFFYSDNRPAPKYKMSLIEKNMSFDVYSLSYQSRKFLNEEIELHGLLYMPNAENKVPALVYLPGGGGLKEKQRDLAEAVVSQGIAFFTLDQRGIGETGGIYLSFQQDYEVYLKGREPIQHLSVYDALISFDVVRSIKGVDKNNIALGGESMGGRYALIAASMDGRITGYLGISTSGFHIARDPTLLSNAYLLSIDPDEYVSHISPRPVLMIHSLNDSVVSVDDAEYTFSLAKEPKSLSIINECNHGYCSAMQASLRIYLQQLFSQRKQN